MLEGFLQFLNATPKGAMMNNAGMLGMSLLNSAQNNKSTQEGLLSALLQSGAANMLNKNPAQQIQQPTQAQVQSAPTQPSVNAMQTAQVPITNSEINMQQLKDAAASAYPTNPMMQQVALAQAIHESGLQDGTPSGLAKQNNLFGIKAPGTAGTVNMPTTEIMNGQAQKVNAAFGANKNVADSFLQHRDLINKQRYQNVLAAQSPLAAFNALQKAGYATDPQYANKLNSVYQKYVMPLYS